MGNKMTRFFVGPDEPTKRQQMLESIAMAEVPRALGLRRFYKYGQSL